MGSCSSKSPPERDRQAPYPVQDDSLSNSDMDGSVVVDSVNKYDDEAINLMKKELRENPEIFLLNNILMSVMFFECYEKEINKIATLASKQEKELNLKLISEESKQCILPDTVMDVVNKHVRFRPIHGPRKQVSQPLGHQRLYLVHDNIEVLEPEDTADYSGIDKPNYRVRVEESKAAGFVKLRQIEKLNAHSTRSNSEETSRSVSSSSFTELNMETNDNLDEPSTSNGLQSNYSSDSYDYATITNVKTPQPLNIKGSSRKSNSFPNSCFTTHMVKNLEDLTEPESEDEEEILKPPPELYRAVTYINSDGFMNYFKNTVFPNSVGKTIGFDDDTIKSATSIPGVIFCDSFDTMGNILHYQVLPAAAIQWPAAITFEWAIREDRPTIIDRRTTFRYKWPTDTMINEIKRLHCVVIPRGYVPKRGENKESNIEWEVGFPKAEKYIDTKMSHAQMRSFLFILALHKTFVEPVTANHGLLIEHIRTHMYWECEANYPNWPENRLGRKLMMVLRHLYDRLGKGHMSDYFIRNKNVLENIPGKYLRPAQRLLHKVMESPVAYFLTALRNLRYMSGKFYPSIDFKKLYIILISDGVKTVNPLLYKMVENERQDAPRRKKTNSPKQEWMLRHHEFSRRKRQEEETVEEKENLTEPRKSVESIDIQWRMEKTMDVFKTRAILLFFIEHFAEMAKRSLKLATTRQSLFYLKQAWYLAKILEDTDGCSPDAMDWQSRIRSEEAKVKKIAANETSVPLTPKRNLAFPFPSADAIQQVKSNHIHLSNLNRSYNNGLQSERKITRTPSSRKVVVDVHENSSRSENGFQMNSPGKSDRRKTITFSSDVQTSEM